MRRSLWWWWAWVVCESGVVLGQAVEPPLQVRWRLAAPGGFYSAPTVVGPVVYAGALDGQVYALDAASGDVRWRYQTGDKLYAQVTAAGQLVYAASADRTLYALEAGTGRLRWKRTLDGILYAAPQVANGRLVIGTGETGTLSGLDAGSGERRWTYQLGGRLGSGLVIRDGLVYAGSFDRKLHVLDLATGERRWTAEVGGLVDSAPLVTADAIYVKRPDDTVLALAPADGHQLWQAKSDAPPVSADQISNWSGLALSGDLLLFGSQDKHLYALDRRTGERRWALAGEDEFPAAPLVVGATGVLGSKDGSLTIVDLATGQARWRWTTPQPAGDAYLRGIMWPPVAADGRVYAASLDGHLYAFERQAAPRPQTAPAVAARPPAGPPAAKVTAAPSLRAARVALRPVGDPPGAAYKLSFDLPAVWPSGAVAATLFDSRATRGYLALVEAGRLQLRRVADGVETPLAEARLSAPPRRLTIHRDRRRIRLLVDGQVAVAAFDATCDVGPAYLGSSTPALRVGEPDVQPLEALWFTDDFMRSGDGHGAWKPLLGAWAASGVSEENAKEDKRPRPDFSSNPFAYRADDVAGTALAVAGEWWWDTYRCEASVRPGQRHPKATEAPTVGLAACLGDARDGLFFEWGAAGTGEERRLVDVRDGRRTVLAAGNGGWADDQWYRLGLTVADGWALAAIDGEVVLRAPEPRPGQGRTGLLARGVTTADFDDVTVQSVDDVLDAFDRPSRGLWRLVTGTWVDDYTVRGPLDSGVKLHRGPGEGQIVTGGDDWRDVRVAVQGRASAAGGFGLVTAWRDPGNLILLRWGEATAPAPWRGRLQLVRVRDGRAQVLDERAAPLPADTWRQVTLEERAGYLRASVDGRPQLEAWQPDLTGGRVGLLALGQATFARVETTLLEPDDRVEFEPPVAEQFSKEELMAGWAQPSGAWRVKDADRRAGVIWHYGDFQGDTLVAIAKALFAERDRTVRVLLAADGEQADSGFTVVLDRDEQRADRLAASIQVRGREVAKGAVDLADAEAVRCWQRGRHVLVAADDRVALSAAADAPAPTGAKVGLAGGLTADDLEQVAAKTTHSFDTTFVAAPVEWRTAKGIWETTNRWKCDARWSFFGGFNDLNPVIWTKDDYAGDLQVEAFMGIRMDSRSQPHYKHPSDLCVSLCGDGVDLLSGYSFLFAARNNTCALLYREGREIAKNTGPEARFRFTSDEGEGLKEFHRHWFHLVVRRAGGRLTAEVDDRRVFDVADPTPLAGGKVAIYAVNNGVLVSRARIGYERLDTRRPFPDVGAQRALADRGEGGGDPYRCDFETGLGAFVLDQPRAPVLLTRTRQAAAGRYALEARNLTCGGTFAVRAVDQPYQAADRPVVQFRYRLSPGTRLNLYALVRDQWQVVRFSGGDAVGDGQQSAGGIEGVAADGQWHSAAFDLGAALRKRLSGDVTVERLVFAMWEPDPYLHAGFGANPYGATVQLDDFALVKTGAAGR